MNKRKSRIIAFAMLVIGVCFIAVALNNPQLSWPWSVFGKIEIEQKGSRM